MTRAPRAASSRVATFALTGMALACGPRATAAPPLGSPPSKAVVTASAVTSGCEAAERTAEGWLASGRFGRALVALRALRAASCVGADALSRAIDEKRRALGLSTTPPSAALRSGLARVRQLRAQSLIEQARASVRGLLSASPGEAFVLAEAGLVEHAGGELDAARSYFERAMLAFGAPELESEEERYGDFFNLTFGPDSEIWSCNSRLRVTDANTLEPLLRIPLGEGCTGLDVSEAGGLVTTEGSIDRASFAEARFGQGLRAVRFADGALLGLSERDGAEGLAFGARGASGELSGEALSLPAGDANDRAISRDPEGSWTVVSATDMAWAFDSSIQARPLELDGPAVAVRGKRAVVNRGDFAELIELPSKRRVRRVPLEPCSPKRASLGNFRWATTSRDGRTVALSNCASISTWRWSDAEAKPLVADPDVGLGPGGSPEAFALSFDGALLVRAASSALQVFDTRTGKKLRGSERAGAYQLSVSAAPNGALALTTSERRAFVVSEAGKLEGEVPVQSNCRAPSWYDDESLLLGCGLDLIRVSRAGARTLSKTRLKAAPEGAFAVPPGHAVIARENASDLVLLESGKIEREIPGRVAWVSPDGKLAVSTQFESDGSSTLAVVSLATGATLARAPDRFALADVDPVTGALLVFGAGLWYFAPGEPHGKRLAQQPALKAPPGTWLTVLRFSTDRQSAVVGFGDGSSRIWELSTGRASQGPSEAVRGLVWSGNRGYRRSDGKQVVTIESTPSGQAFYVITAPGAIEFLGGEPAGLPICSFGVAQFPFELCRDAVTVPGLLRQWVTRGEWYGG